MCLVCSDALFLAITHSLRIENPYNAAQTFLQSNDLPLTYLDEVVKFIEKGTSGVSLGGGGEDYVDPFTGACRI